MNSYFLDITGNYFFLILLCIISIAFSIFSYYKTNPAIEKAPKIALITLRSIALCLIIFALFEPIFTSISTYNKSAQLAVLLDDSQSLSIKTNNNTPKQYKELLSNIDFSKLDTNVKFYKFSEETFLINNFNFDSLSLKGQTTNISQALYSITKDAEQDNTKAILLITDGAFNSGTNPIFDAEYFANPIYTIGIGDTNEAKDIALISLITNKIAYIDNTIPVNINFNSSGFNENVKITLYDNNNKIAEKNIVLSDDHVNYTANFEFTPKTEGVHKITAKITELKGEITTKNNIISEFVKVLKNKRVISLFAGASNPDLAFIKRTLLEETGIEINEFVQKQGSEFYNNPTAQKISETDIFILIGFPAASTPNQILELINKELNTGKPIFFIAGLSTDYNKLKTIQDHLPFTVLSSKPREFSVIPNINVKSLSNPLLRVTGIDDDIELWNNLPPLFKTETFVKTKAGSEIVSTMKVNNVALNDPLIITRETQNKKSVAIMGYGLYRWKLQGYANEKAKGMQVPDLFATLINNSFKWLSVYEKNKTINVHTTKQQYNQSEKIEFFAEIYDNAFVPIENAEVNINVKSNSETRNLILTSIGNGRYYGELEGLRKGDYAFDAVATAGSRKLGSDNGRFIVDELSIEFQNLKQNTALLKDIAKRTNGKFYNINNKQEIKSIIDDIINNSNFKTKPITLRNDFQLWNWIWLLLISIACFAAEWFIRKRKGLL
ncbi:MAG: VWA domain-containing protein [Bacteroidetes bacterium]|nr:VWA domain-containing protein [Bacteroidota bacterium]